MKIVISLLLFIFIHSHANATTYHLSDKGSDSNNGKSKASAWRSLKNLSHSMHLIESGDSILFESGSKFKGMLDVSCSGIYFGSYGAGTKPLISGSIELNNWRPFKKNIWKSYCSDCPSTTDNVFFDGKYLPRGRYPNRGYLTVSGSIENQHSISDSTLHFIDGYWNGAEVVVKSSRWTIDKLLVKDYTNHTFHSIVPASYRILNGFGYFIQNHLATLDQSGEWFFDSHTKTVFLYLDPATNPTDHIIEVSIADSGLNAEFTYGNTVENLSFTHYKVGATITHGTNIKLLNVDISNSSKNGLEVIGSKNTIVNNCRITDSNNNGVAWHNNIGGSFTHNTVSRTGLRPGRGESGNGTYIGIYVTADSPSLDDNLFEHNTIDSVGYSGIDFRTGNTCIRNNIITNFCIIKDDGGGIYTWNNTLSGNHIEGNIIRNGIGSGEGTHHPTRLLANGIYIDDRSSNVSINNNAISHCSTAGIFLHNTKNISVVANVVFANGTNLSNKERGQLVIKLDALGQWPDKVDPHLNITQNKLTTMSDVSYCIFLSADRQQDLAQLGTLSDNLFRAPYPEQAVAESCLQTGLCSAPLQFTLVDWQKHTFYERGSSFNKVKERFTIQSRNLLQNSSITTNPDGWMIWPERSTIVFDTREHVEDPLLRINIPDKTEALLYDAGFSLVKGKIYRLAFSAMSNGPCKLEFVPLMNTEPWLSLGDYTCFTLTSTFKTFTYFFTPTISSTEARVNFKSNKTFWIYNVSLYEITESPGGPGTNPLGSR